MDRFQQISDCLSQLRDYASAHPEIEPCSDRLATLVMPLARVEIPPELESAGFTPTEQAILEFLLAKKGKPARRHTLHDFLYAANPNGGPDPKVIDVFICKLRKRLHQSGLPLRIDTMWGTGYALVSTDTPPQPHKVGRRLAEKYS